MPDLIDFHTDADVYSSDGHKLGQLKGLVLRRADLMVTKLVIDVGFLRSGHSLWEGGLGLEYDRVVPIDDVASVSEERLVLGIPASIFREAPEYTEETYEAPQDLSPNEFDLSDFVERATTISAALNSVAGTWLIEKQRRSRDEADIEENTPVWRVEPHDKIGEVHRILVDNATRAVAALVVKRGFLLKRDVVLPFRYVTEILDVAIHVDISDSELDALPEYTG